MLSHQLMLEKIELVHNKEAVFSQKQFDFLESALDTKLPIDYKMLCSNFPYGAFFGYVSLYNLDMPGGIERVIRKIKAQLSVMEDCLDSLPEMRNYKIFPEDNGLLPIGFSENLDYLCLVRTGDCLLYTSDAADE